MNREPSMGRALERTYEAGQALIVQRIDLLVAESKLLVRSGRMVALGAVLALTGWIYLVHGTIDGLALHYPRFAVELTVGLVHLGLAVLLVARARTRVDG